MNFDDHPLVDIFNEYRACRKELENDPNVHLDYLREIYMELEKYQTPFWATKEQILIDEQLKTSLIMKVAKRIELISSIFEI